jgi:hypothetical protein
VGCFRAPCERHCAALRRTIAFARRNERVHHERFLLTLFCGAVLMTLAAPAMSHDCRVRDAYHRGAYEGDCDERTEMAQGKGEAKGADSYVGNFAKGRPDGKGVYTWESGARLDASFKEGKAYGPGVYVSAKAQTATVQTIMLSLSSFTCLPSSGQIFIFSWILVIGLQRCQYF